MVYECVAIADDLTGANVLGVLLRKAGFKATTIFSLQESVLKDINNFGEIIYSTDSREYLPKKAYDCVFRAISLLDSARKKQEGTVRIYSKRIDSTLRGNVGQEIDAMLDYLNDDRVALVVPSFPLAGRIVVDGSLLMDGIKLHESTMASDFEPAINTSIVKEIIGHQSKRKIGVITYKILRLGVISIKSEIEKLYRNGYRIIIIDAASEQEISLISEAVLDSRTPFLATDPGPFTANLMEETKYGNDKKAKVMITIGSITDMTRRQIEYFCETNKVYQIMIDVAKLIYSKDERYIEISRVISEILENITDYNYCCLTTSTLARDHRINFDLTTKKTGLQREQILRLINDSIAEVTYQVLQGCDAIKGLFCSGGDITVAISKAAGAFGISLVNEIIPLVAFGFLIGGEYENLPIVTKGGLVGDEKAIETCVHFLFKEINKTDKQS